MKAIQHLAFLIVFDWLPVYNPSLGNVHRAIAPPSNNSLWLSTKVSSCSGEHFVALGIDPIPCQNLAIVVESQNMSAANRELTKRGSALRKIFQASKVLGNFSYIPAIGSVQDTQSIRLAF